jgi:hypothetical protein
MSEGLFYWLCDAIFGRNARNCGKKGSILSRSPGILADEMFVLLLEKDFLKK